MTGQINVADKFTQNVEITWGLVLLQLIIGVSAVAGGWTFAAYPDGAALGMDVTLLEQSPFASYLIPGLILLVINGFGQLAGAVTTLTKNRHAGEVAIALGLFLIAWIVLQVWWIGLSSWLQPLCLSFGILEVTLGVLIRMPRLHGSGSTQYEGEWYVT